MQFYHLMSLRCSVQRFDITINRFVVIKFKMMLFNVNFFIDLIHQEIADMKSLSSEEIISLKAEMERRTTDAENYGLEKREADLMLTDLRGEIQRLNGTFRELEMTANQQAINSARLEHELERSKQQLEQKDVDLRMTMSSLTEERLAVRADMNALQTRITLLEQERLETVSQLAGKREECLSTGRELVQLREILTALESKVETILFSAQ